MSSSEEGLQHALDMFDAECSDAGMSVAKTETLLLSRRPGQCTLHVSGVRLKQVEKFEYFGVAFTSDGRQDIELDTRIAAAGTVMRQLQRSVLLRPQIAYTSICSEVMEHMHSSIMHHLDRHSILAVFKSVFVPILTYIHEPWVMTERSRIRAAEVAFLRRISGLTMLDRVRSLEIR
ncbi:Uncharacterised protein r2_g1125 [Pycnogonum litorale]